MKQTAVVAIDSAAPEALGIPMTFIRNTLQHLSTMGSPGSSPSVQTGIYDVSKREWVWTSDPSLGTSSGSGPESVMQLLVAMSDQLSILDLTRAKAIFRPRLESHVTVLVPTVEGVRATPRNLTAVISSMIRRNHTEIGVIRVTSDGTFHCASGSIGTSESPARNARLAFKAARALGITTLASLVAGSGSAPAIRTNQGVTYQFQTLPSSVLWLADFCIRAVRRIERKVRKFDQADWACFWVPASEHGNFDLSNAKEILPAVGRFLADPFIFHSDDATFLLVEEFMEARNEGDISAYQRNDGSWEFAGTILTRPGHLSFPFTMKLRHGLVMIPESNELGDSKVYITSTPTVALQEASTLASGKRIVDLVLWDSEEHGLVAIYTSDLANLGDRTLQLQATKLQDLGDGAIDRNQRPFPDLVDAQGGRNGGLLAFQGTSYRVAQMQGYATYGWGISIRRLTGYGLTGIQEREILSIVPRRNGCIRAIHHLSMADDLMAFDAVVDRRKWNEMTKQGKSPLVESLQMIRAETMDSLDERLIRRLGVK